MPPGEHLFHAGDLGDAFHYIDRGRVLVLVTAPAGTTSRSACSVPARASASRPSSTPASRRTATVRALEPTETLVLSRPDFEHLRARNSQIERMLTNVLADQVRGLTKRLVEALTEPVEVRVFRRLLDLGALYEVTGTTEPIPMTQEQIAAMAGAGLRITNRVLNQAARDGVLETRRRRIVITDWDELRRRAQIDR